ncbi:MAG: hypothetical protein JSW11_11745 [Candidatus Heimdallarchaeota archaeon]|nr:MAG: hypothetical protein JSW11_11745 [Candidatus Heimdallarchaeota archaeon]
MSLFFIFSTRKELDDFLIETIITLARYEQPIFYVFLFVFSIFSVPALSLSFIGEHATSMEMMTDPKFILFIMVFVDGLLFCSYILTNKNHKRLYWYLAIPILLITYGLIILALFMFYILILPQQDLEIWSVLLFLPPVIMTVGISSFLRSLDIFQREYTPLLSAIVFIILLIFIFGLYYAGQFLLIILLFLTIDIANIEIRNNIVYGLLLSLNVVIVLFSIKDCSRLFPTKKRLVYVVINITIAITVVLSLIGGNNQLDLLGSLIIPLWFMTNIGNSIILTLILFYAIKSSASRFKEYKETSETELPKHIKKVFTTYDVL